MGQTLSHGVYLPNEGERNCYAGLASNWQILNTAVGAISEKAPLVHTHTVSQITDFPAYGNAAGTICEGNDSRLSDARTPVAHTHTKSDVTDLLNSNFIPSANNSYDLGSSSYQWNNLCAKNYYYNGTEFQSKFATLDTPQTISANKTFTGEVRFQASNVYHIAEDPSYVLKSSTMQGGVVPSGDRSAYTGNWLDKDSSTLGYDRFVFYAAVKVQAYEVNLRNKAANGSFDPNGSLIQSGYQLALYPNGNSELKIYAHILPNGNGVWNLGDSTHKWKTLNGINPGALSLPDTLGTSGTENVNYFNVIGYLNNTGTVATIPSTATYDGWLYINAKDGAGSYIIVDDYPSSFGTSVFGNNGLGSQSIGLLCLMCPIRKGHSYNVRIKSAGIVSARIYPAQGNV